MAVIDCILRESLRVERGIRVQVTGRCGDMLYLFIDADARHELRGVGGFHASAPSGIRRVAHVLALRDGDSFSIGAVWISVESAHLRIEGAYALRDVRLRIVSPTRIVREKAPRMAYMVCRWSRPSCFC